MSITAGFRPINHMLATIDHQVDTDNSHISYEHTATTMPQSTENKRTQATST